MKKIMFFGLLSGLLLTSPGCGLFQAIFCYRPCASRGTCGSGYCGDDCDDGCGQPCSRVNRPVRAPAPVQRRATGCDCGNGCCDDCATPCRKTGCRSCSSCNDGCECGCDDGCNQGRTWHRGPLSCVFALLFDGCNWCPSCSKERYWSDFYNDPPDCEDPCDCYGNYKACKGCSWGRKPRGQKYREYNEVPQEETIMEGEEGTVTGDRVVPSNQQRTNKVQPTPANQPHKAVRPDTASTN